MCFVENMLKNESITAFFLTLLMTESPRMMSMIPTPNSNDKANFAGMLIASNKTASPAMNNVRVWPAPHSAPSSDALLSLLFLLTNVATAVM
jgi:hypothetical protein